MQSASPSSSISLVAIWLCGLLAFFAAMVTIPLGIACLRDSGLAGASITDETETELREELAEEVQQWNEMWDEIEEQGVEALDPGIMIAGAQYAGDTCGMRYRLIYRRIDRGVRDRLVIAAFANDPEVKRQVLVPLLQAEDPAIRGRTVVELARIALRQGDAAAAETALATAEGLDLAPACAADLRYLKGQAAAAAQKLASAVEAFAAATELDPGFWNAYRDQIPILVRQLHDQALGSAACLRSARRLIQILGLLPQLAADTRQFAKLALSLERLGLHSSATRLAAAMTWQWAGQEAHGRSLLEAALEGPETMPAACERAVRARVAEAMEAA